jgi:amino acid adenylation domain-containing protein
VRNFGTGGSLCVPSAATSVAGSRTLAHQNGHSRNGTAFRDEDAAHGRAPIAIVGVGALFPGSNGPAGFWHDIVHGVDRITDVPPTHWLIDDYYDPDPKAADKTYSKRGAFLGPTAFDPLEFAIPPSAIPSTDTSQLLALVVAKHVFADASRMRFGTIDRNRTSVILGVASATELVVSMGARLQRPVWVKALRESGLPEAKVQEICERISDSYVPWQESSFPGMLGNVVAGRIANRLDLGGTNAVTDAACASSLSALAMGANELELGHSDLAIVGGVDALNDILMYMCFSKTPALSQTGDCRPFSEQADGTIMGEGLGMFALRRLADAERDGNHIYALIRGVGSSSDGQATSVYAPRADGQASALTRAYAAAGYSPRTVGLVEAHGTATNAGDLAEFTALASVFGAESDDRQWCALGSVKSQIGHTKAAAGAAGLFKAVMALNHKILPPTIKVGQPAKNLPIAESSFYLNTETRPWIADRAHPRRASVSSFGFGGSNFHVALEEYTGAAERAPRYPTWKSELILLSAASRAALATACTELPARNALSATARESQKRFDSSAPFRLAIVADSQADLEARLQTVARHLADDARTPLPAKCYLGSESLAESRLAFVFPGQGSQYCAMGAELAMSFDAARQVWDAEAAAAGDEREALHHAVFPLPVFAERDKASQTAALTATAVAQPAIAATSLSMLALLQAVGLAPDAVAGHSSGELTALCAAGVFDPATLIAAARRRGELMAQAAQGEGAMAAVGAGRDAVGALLSQWALPVVIANDNSPEQVVLSGSTDAIGKALEHLASTGIGARRLAVASAFHSTIVADSVEPFRRFLADVTVETPALHVYANSTAAPYAEHAEDIRDLLAGQIAQPVRFRDTIEAMYAAGIRHFVEVGPGNVLSGLIAACLKGRDHSTIALDRRGSGGVESLWDALGKLSALGYAIDFAPLWDGYATDDAPPQQHGKHVIMMTGANVGKPYPPPNGAAGVPPPNKMPAAEIPAPNKVSAAQMPAPEIPARIEPQRADSAAHLAVHHQVAETHAAFARQMSEAHQAYLNVVGTAIAALSGQQAVGAQPLRYTDQKVWTPPVLAGPSERGTQAPADVEQMAPAPLSPMPPHTSPVHVRVPEQPASRGDVASILMAIVAEKTGYPVDMLAPEMDLQADLGIDSIKQVEILSTLRDRFPDLPELEPTQLGELRTLGRIVGVLSAGAAQAPASGKDIASILMAIVAEKTGYPVDMLAPEMDLQADLGIDSIKQVEILSTLRDRFPDLPELEPTQLGELRTLGRIIGVLQGGAGQSSVVTAIIDDVAREPIAIERRTVRIISSPVSDERNRSVFGASHIEIIAGADGVAHELEAAFAQRGYSARIVDEISSNADAVVYLGGLCESADASTSVAVHRDAFLAARAVASRFAQHGGTFVTVADTGGNFGFDGRAGERAWLGGLPGLVKTAALEWPQAQVKAIDIERADRSKATVAGLIADEIIGGGREHEVGLTADGQRLTLETIVEAAQETPRELFDSSSVLVVTGGARGVTAAAMVALLRRFPCRCVILGRTVLDDEPPGLHGERSEQSLRRALAERARLAGQTLRPAQIAAAASAILAAREARANLAALSETGAEVRYVAVDIRDGAAVADALDGIRAQWGPITGIVHGAGAIADKLIADKTVEQFDTVFHTKVTGLASLLAACANDPLRVICLFSSVAARFGNYGQCDYAMANEVLNKIAHAQARTRNAGCIVKAIAWGPWAGGMVTPELRDTFERQGVPVIPLDDGADFFVHELLSGPIADVEVIAVARASDEPPGDGREHVRTLSDAIRACLAEQLRIEPDLVPLDVPLAALGLTSLGVTRLKDVLEVDFGYDVSLTSLMEASGISDLAANVEKPTTANVEKLTTTAANVEQQTADTIVESPASYGQAALWYLHQLDPNQSAYNIFAALRIRGSLHIDRLERSLQTLVQRHAALRTTFAMHDSELVQHVHSVMPLDMIVENAPGGEDDLRLLLASQAHRPFDLAHGPLLRVRVYRVRDDVHVFLICLHHSVTDLSSFVILGAELQALYAGGSLAAPSQLTFAEFAAEQRHRAQDGQFAEHLRYWESQLGSDLPALSLPLDRPRPAVQTFSGASHEFRVNAELTQRIKSLAKAREASVFTVMLAAYQILLHRHSGQADIVVGIPSDGRANAGLRQLVGYLTNPLAIRTRFDDGATFNDLLARVRVTMLDAITHQDLPFARLVETLIPNREASRAPLFQTMFTLHECEPQIANLWGAFAAGAESTATVAGDLTFEPFAVAQRTVPFDLTLTMVEGAGELAASFAFNSDLFDAATIARMSDHLCVLLDGLARQPDIPVSELALLTARERHEMLVDWNDTATPFDDVCIHKLFEAQVLRTPDNIAVVFEDEQLTYSELDARANRLAHSLQARGVGPGVTVGLFLERSLELIVAVFGTLKAGGTYVPLNVDYPAQRIAFVLGDARPVIVLTHSDHRAALSNTSQEIVCLDADWASIASLPATAPACDATPESVAYILYTSGSTGTPKGVAVNHRSLSNFFQNWIPISESDRVLQRAPFTFDVAARECFQPLLCGATLIMAAPHGDQDPTYLVDVIGAKGVTLLGLSPSMLDVFLDEPGLDRCTSLRRVVSCGEALSVQTQRRFFTTLSAELYNAYGPTEATIDVTAWLCRPEHDAVLVPIGRPIANVQLYILDGHFAPVPVGVTGELYIAGACLARGYWNHPDLTEQRFVPNPFADASGERMYRSGDRARYRADGTIEFLGRLDDQVKIRGNRVELGEIEATLAAHSAVTAAAVIVREDRANDPRLVAYVVSEGPSLAIDDLRRMVRDRLPDYMMPSAFVVLPSLPLTTNGKLDRAALPLPFAPSPKTSQADLPHDDVERDVAALWVETLGLPSASVDINADFFDLGGHSLLALRLLTAVDGRFGRRPSLKSFLREPTVAGVARHLRSDAGDMDAVESVPRTGIADPSVRRHALFLAGASYHTLLSLRALAQHLPAHYDIFTLQPPARHDDALPFASIEELAQTYLTAVRKIQPEGPYLLAGYSIAGLATFELAQQLLAQGQEVAFLGFFDTWFPTAMRGQSAVFGALSSVARWASEIAGGSAMPAWFRSWVLDAAAVAQVKAARTYRPRTYPGQITLFKTSELPVPEVIAAAKWREVALGGLKEIQTGGRHDTMLSAPHVQHLAHVLEGELDAALNATTRTHLIEQSTH